MIETVNETVAAGARVPFGGVTVTHTGPDPDVQLREDPPVFSRMYAWLDGLKAPPTGPEDVNTAVVSRDRKPAGGALTVRPTDRLSFPAPSVVLVNNTVSE